MTSTGLDVTHGNANGSSRVEPAELQLITGSAAPATSATSCGTTTVCAASHTSHTVRSPAHAPITDEQSQTAANKKTNQYIPRAMKSSHTSQRVGGGGASDPELCSSGHPMGSKVRCGSPTVVGAWQIGHKLVLAAHSVCTGPSPHGCKVTASVVRIWSAHTMHDGGVPALMSAVSLCIQHTAQET
jgi:hypothetical protein